MVSKMDHNMVQELLQSLRVIDLTAKKFQPMTFKEMDVSPAISNLFKMESKPS